MYLVSPQKIHAIEIAIVACLFAVAIVVLSKRGRISFRYTIGWLALCALSAFVHPVINKHFRFTISASKDE